MMFQIELTIFEIFTLQGYEMMTILNSNLNLISSAT